MIGYKSVHDYYLIGLNTQNEHIFKYIKKTQDGTLRTCLKVFFSYFWIMSAEKIIKIEHENLSDSSGTTIADTNIILQKKINKIFPKVDVTALLALRREKRKRLLLFIGIFVFIINIIGITLSL